MCQINSLQMDNNGGYSINLGLSIHFCSLVTIPFLLLLQSPKSLANLIVQGVEFSLNFLLALCVGRFKLHL